MRIVILSIALLFCAFSAHSQVLKSAGVWYFLDVDSLNNRPAQLPNGTELAYVVGTKKIYRWNRALSVWEEYSSGAAGLTMPFDSIYFTPTTADPDTAELKYNADLETFVFGADGTIIEIGQKTAWYVKNQTGSTITKGTVVRASGTLGSSGRILISPMVIDGTVSSKYLLGITASDIANGSDGYVIHFGKLRKFNTSAWSDGAVLYAGTGGTLTATEPSPPNLRLPIAFVVHSHATNGILAIRIQTGNELHELHDVDTTGIQNNGLLTWNSSSQKWQAAAPDNDKSSTNEIQTLSFASPLLGISSGNNVDLSPILTGYITGSGATNYVPKFSALTNLTASNIFDNNTYAGVISRPWKFGEYTTAGLPTGVTGYHVYNTTIGGTGWYDGTRWNYVPKADRSAFTSTRVPIVNSSGQLTEDPAIVFDGTNNVLTISNDGTTEGVIAIDGQTTSTGNPGRISYTSGAAYTQGLEITSNKWIRLSSSAVDNYVSSAINVFSGNYVGLGGAAVGGRSIVLTGAPASTRFTTYALFNAIDGNFASTIYTTPLFIRGGNASTAHSSGVAHGGDVVIFGGTPISTGNAGDVILAYNGTTALGKVGIAGTPSYQLHVNGTDAIGIPRGTVAQRPTIVSSTTPFRFNTDSTALEYGESVGTWRQLATRAYARSLALSLPTTITAGHVAYSNGTSLVGSANHFWDNVNNRLGLGTNTPATTLHVEGDARITVLGYTPDQIVGADGDGNLGVMSLDGLSVVSGTLGIIADSLEKNAGVLFVSKNGNNGTGLRNNPRLPFLTIYAAVVAAQPGDLIYIHPGVYNESSAKLGRDSINFYCSPGVTVSNAVITDDYGTSDMDNGGYVRWFGSGVFDNCTVSIQHMNMRYHIEGDSISLVYIPFWKIINYNDIRLKFKFRSVRTQNSQLVWIPGKTSELTYTRMNLIFEIDRLYSPEATRNNPLIHFANGAGGTDADAKSKFVDCNFIFDIKNIELNGAAIVGSFPKLQGIILGIGGVNGRIHFQRSNFTFNSDYIVQTGSSGNTYETPFQGFENSQALFGVGTFKLDSSRLNFNIKSLHADVHAFRIGEFYQGNKGMLNINGNLTTRQLATFHIEETGSGATGDTSILIRINGNFSSDKEVVTCYTTVPTEKITWQGNYVSFADKAVFAIKSDMFTLSNTLLKNNGTTADIYAAEARTIKIAGAYAENLTVSSNVTANWLDNIGNPKFFGYGVNAKSASALGKTATNQNAAWATDGTLYEIERKRDTTIYVTADTDYDFSAAVTTAQIARRYNRIIIHMTLTSGVGADKTTTLHTPDANLMQCEILIRGTDNTGTYDNEIAFGTNNAISSDGTNTSGYTLAQGQGLHVRVVYNGSTYKYIYY